MLDKTIRVLKVVQILTSTVVVWVNYRDIRNIIMSTKANVSCDNFF